MQSKTQQRAHQIFTMTLLLLLLSAVIRISKNFFPALVAQYAQSGVLELLTDPIVGKGLLNVTLIVLQ